MKGSEGTDLERGDAMNAVVDRTGRAGEVEDVIDFAYVKWFANVFFHELETRLMIQVCEVGAAPGEKVIDDNYIPAFSKQSIAEMGPQKAGAAGDYRAFQTHAFLPFLKS